MYKRNAPKRSARARLLPFVAIGLIWHVACRSSNEAQNFRETSRNEAGGPGTNETSGSFVYHRHLILTPALINGAEAGLALIDTGATACALDERLAERLGVPMAESVEVHGTAGTTKARSANLATLTAFGRTVKEAEATVYPLSLLPGPSGEPVNLIIGYPFLKHFAVDIDYVQKRLTLREKAVRARRSLPMRVDDRIPRVSGTLDGVASAEFRIDTGASLFETPETYLNITAAMLDALAARGFDRKPAQRLSGTGVGGAVELPVYRLDRVAFGTIELQQPMAIVQPRQGIFARDETPGFIANYTLHGWKRVVIDYLDSTLDLPEPGE